MSTALMSHWRGIWEMAYTVHCVHTYTSGPIGLYLWVYICDASIEHHHGYKVGPIDLHAHFRNTNHDSMHACKKAIGPPTSQAATHRHQRRQGRHPCWPPPLLQPPPAAGGPCLPLQWVVGLKQAHLHMYVQYASHVGSELIGPVSSYMGGNATHVWVCG